jgi:CRP-like cAMP-binding protein
MPERFTFEDLPPELKPHLRYRELATRELLLHEGDPAQAIYYLQSGQIRLVNYTPSGKVVDHYTVMEGEFFAEVLMILDFCTCSAIADEPSKVVIIPKEPWLETLRKRPEVAIAFAGELAFRIHMVKITMQLRGIRAATDRVIAYLQIMAPPGSKVVTLSRPLKQIAQDLDLAPETLSRVLAQLTAENRIQRENGRILLVE